MTALSLYGLSAASSTLTTAATFASVTGGTGTTVNTSITSGSGYYELLGKGGTSSANVSLPTPTGNGWLWDVITLEGNTLQSGTYTYTVALAIGSGTITANSFTIRTYKYNAGTYTAINSATSTSFSITTTLSGFVQTASVSSVAFSTGEKFYVDAFLNAAPASTRSIHVGVSSTSTGLTSEMQIDTPGFLATGTGTHLRIMDGYGGVFS